MVYLLANAVKNKYVIKYMPSESLIKIYVSEVCIRP